MGIMVRLNGISLVDMPYIRNEWRSEDMHDLMVSGALGKMQGEAGTVIRENGELYDSDNYPALSVRMDGYHVGYIPLVPTIMKEALKARDGFKKVWKDGLESMNPDQLRAESKLMIERGEDAVLCKFVEVDKTDKEAVEKLRLRAKWKSEEARNLELVRDWLRTEMERNHNQTPLCRIIPLYWDEATGKTNRSEIGEICSVSVLFEELDY